MTAEIIIAQIYKNICAIDCKKLFLRHNAKKEYNYT